MITKYLKNIKQCLELDNNKELLLLNDKEKIINEIKERLEMKRRIFRENKSILNNVIFSKKYDTQNISVDEFKEIEDFADKTFSQYPYIDSGVCCEAYTILLENALYIQDDNLILIEALKKGNALYNLDNNIFQEEIKSYYSMYKNYTSKYFSLNKKVKIAYNECLINYVKIFEITSIDKVKELLDLFYSSIKFWQNEEVRKDDLSFDDYIEDTKLIVIRLISKYFTFNEKDNYLLNETLKIVESLKKETPNIIYKINNDIMRYFCGKIKIQELLDIFKDTIDTAKISTDDETGILFFKLSRIYLVFMDKYSGFSKEIKTNIRVDINRRIMKYINIFEKERISIALDKEILLYLEDNIYVIPEENIKELLFNFTVFRHFPTYVHTLIVEKIAVVLLKGLYKHNLNYLLGILDNADISFLNNNYEIVEESLINACHYHDVGMHSCLECITNSYRRLTENEFEIIKNHTDYGSNMLYKAGGDPINYESARLHHLWYDEQFGYPDNYCRTNNSPLIDILSVADSIDAATDTLGRIYSNNKDFTELTEELLGYANTRYSKVIVDLLLDSEVNNKIREIVTKKREEIYVKALYDFYK